MNTKWLKFAYVLLPLLTCIALVGQVVVSNQLVSLGKELSALDAAISEQRDIHEDLSAKVASASSLAAIRDQAEAMGFREPVKSQIVVLPHVAPVAFSVTQ